MEYKDFKNTLRLLVDFTRDSLYMLLYASCSFFLSVLPVIYSLPISVLGLIFLIFVYSTRRAEIDLKSLMGSMLSGSFPAYSALLSAVLFVMYSSWLSDTLILFLNNLDRIEYAFSSLLYAVFILGIVPVFAISIKHKRVVSTKEIEPKKVLILALSDPSRWINKEEFNELKRAVEEGNEDKLKEMKRINWAPLLRSFLVHESTLERWYVLVSDKSEKYKDKFEELISTRGKDAKKKIIFVPSEGYVDFDDYENIYTNLLKVLRKIRSEGYMDRDISVYISGGTSAITLAFTVFAIKEGRQVEYMKQSNSELCKIDINFEDIYSFAPEERKIT